MESATWARLFVKRSLARVGVDVRRRPRDLHPTLSAFDARRRRFFTDAEVNFAIDVGANAGQFGHLLRKSDYTGPILSIEPTSSAFARLQRVCSLDAAWHPIHAAVGARAGTAAINLAGNSWSSSLLEMEDRHASVAPDSVYIGREVTPVYPLDQLALARLDESSRVFLKIDVQGFELEVIAGASKVLAATALLELEVSLVPLYTGAPSHIDVLKTIDREGYEIIAVGEEFVDPTSSKTLQLNVIASR
jgi:FkbM family methyltransferase